MERPEDQGSGYFTSDFHRACRKGRQNDKTGRRPCASRRRQGADLYKGKLKKIHAGAAVLSGSRYLVPMKKTTICYIKSIIYC